MSKKYKVEGLTKLKKRYYTFSWNSPLGEYIKTNPIKGLLMLFRQWWSYIPNWDYDNIDESRIS